MDEVDDLFLDADRDEDAIEDDGDAFDWIEEEDEQ
jgi:hypothetical protein